MTLFSRHARLALRICFAGVLGLACSMASQAASPGLPASAPPAVSGSPAIARVVQCSGEDRMVVRFYDVGQALSALVELPDGRRVLVDAGESPHRPSCGEPCLASNRHLVERLRADLAGAPLDLLWITHQHSDHIGGAPELLETFHVGVYADNGRDARRGEVQRARRAAEDRRTLVRVIDLEHRELPLSMARNANLVVAPVLPAAWPGSCAHDANDCSIGLRIDFCRSSVLFTGDAEHEEEAQLEGLRPVTLLQVGHHGSETSTTPAFLSRVRPSYAVISSGKPGEGLNADYCHPRAQIVSRLTRVLGGPGASTVHAFDGARCANSVSADWVDVPVSDRLWSTARDGDVVLTTSGDGTFTRVLSPPSAPVTSPAR